MVFIKGFIHTHHTFYLFTVSEVVQLDTSMLACNKSLAVDLDLRLKSQSPSSSTLWGFRIKKYCVLNDDH